MASPIYETRRQLAMKNGLEWRFHSDIPSESLIFKDTKTLSRLNRCHFDDSWLIWFGFRPCASVHHASKTTVGPLLFLSNFNVRLASGAMAGQLFARG